MHSDEIWQVFAPNGEPIVGEGWNSALDNPEENNSDVIVGVTVVFLYRFNQGGKLEFLWQRRSDKVSRYPGDYDISAGGHINLGESLMEAAKREVYEEIGVKIEADDLQFVTLAPFSRNRFAWVYAVDWTGRKDEFAFNDEEVSEVKWVPYVEMEDFRMKYAKQSLKDDKYTFVTIRHWLEMHGLIDGNL